MFVYVEDGAVAAFLPRFCKLLTGDWSPRSLGLALTSAGIGHYGQVDECAMNAEGREGMSALPVIRA